MEIIKNFLLKENFKEIKNIILDKDFPWRIRNRMTDTDENIYFTYCFFNNFLTTSEMHQNYIIPILNKLKAKSVIQVRANLIFNTLFYKSGWHTDYNYDSKTAIFYLNTCNGGTEFKINDKIKFVNAEENKIVVFDSKIEHRVCTSTDCKRRYIINFNYF